MRPQQLLASILLFSMVVVLAAGCGSDSGSRVENQHPVVVIKGGPLNNSIASYTARIFWSGWDEDGLVTHYEYAIDPPTQFSNWEIANPERFSDIHISVLPGPATGEDTLIVSKVVNGETLSFNWVQTHEFSRAFAFQTPNPDSEFVGGQIVPKDQFSGAHVVYVRCQDNEGAYSDADLTTKGDTLEADYIGYTATTQTPSSTIEQPNIQQEIGDLGPTLSVRWDGLDPDSPEADKKPKGFIYNLVRLDALEPPIPILQATPVVLLRFGTWIYQDADSLSKILQLGVPGEYIFGVRAVDVAGAVEPVLAFGKNAFKFQAFPQGGKPDLTIREASIGAVHFRGQGAPQEVEVPANRKLRFSWLATAERYGGTIEAYSWGLDIPDISVEGPESGWSGWGPITSPLNPIIFPNAGTHVLYVRARDVAGSITLAQLILHVIDFSFEREVLMVDDSFDNLAPRDSEHDAFWQDMFSFYVANSNVTPDQIGEFDVHGDGDRGNLQPNVPLLSDLARYKLLVWENFGVGYNSASALIQSTALSPRLSAYLRAGGKLWLDGRMNVAATTPDPNGQGADLTYPKTELGPGDWAWDFLKLHSTKINNDKGTNNANLFHGARQLRLPSGEFMPAIYDTMSVDLTKLSIFQQTYGGFSHCDAVFDPIFAESEPDFQGDIDTLYAYGAAGPEFQGKTSQYLNKLCALRWHDPDPDREHGRLQWFGFAMYFMHQDQARNTFKASLDWLREEQVTP